MSSQMSEDMLFVQILLLIISGPMAVLILKSGIAKNGFEKRRLKFEAGKGKDPAKEPFGPHKGALPNFIAGTLFGLLMGVVMRLSMSMSAG